MSDVVSELMKDYVLKLSAEGKRIDGRTLDQVRPITITKNIIASAEGSAQVNLGETTVIVGVKAQLGEPFADTPNCGVLTTSAELVPMASPTFEAGPPSPVAIELARVVDRGIRESECVDLEKLCVIPGEKVWILFLDLHILDYDGNLFDACSIAALAALASTKIPYSQLDPAKKDEMLELQSWPVSLTAVKIRDSMFADPSLDEETIADSRITVVTNENGNLRAMQKGVGGSITIEDAEKLIAMSVKHGSDVRAKVRGA